MSKILKIKYLSIATFSQNQYSLWHCNKNIKECKVKKYITKSKKWNKFFEEHKKYHNIILNNYKYKLSMLNDYYTTDFNYTICEKYSDKPDLI